MIANEDIATLAEEGTKEYVNGDLINVPGSIFIYRVKDGSKQEANISIAWADKGKLDKLVIPATVTDENSTPWYVKEVWGFNECENLESVTISEGITTLSSRAFSMCQSLGTVDIADTVTSIGYRAFVSCINLKMVEIPDGVTEIQESTFEYCDNLTKVTLPSHLSSIDKMAFFWCENLADIALPDSVTNIGERAFIGCSKIPYVNLKNVKQIGEYAFRGCDGMNNISIPDQLESLGEFAFADCTSWTSDKNNNSNIVIPRSLEKINASTFLNCSGLTEMTIPDSVASIEESAFKDCANLKTLNIAVSNTSASIPVKDSTVFEGCPATLSRKLVFKNADGTAELTGSKLARAQLTYLNAPDGNTDDDLWYGWPIDRPNTYNVTIHVNKDGVEWVDHGRKYALKEDGDTEFITDLAHVPNGTYSIYDITGISEDSLSAMARDTGMDTNVDVTVLDHDAEATVDYFTVTFYDGDVAYSEDTPQKPQIVLSGRQAAKPESDPSKTGYQFLEWKTEDGGSESFDFNKAIDVKTDIYASWQKADTPVPVLTITATADEGGSISPSGRVSVNEGDSQTFTITPKEGNRIKAVTVDGIDRTAELMETPTGVRYYTFTNVTENHTIHAAFESDGSNPGGGGGDNPNPGGGGDNPNPGGGDNPNPGGGGGDNPNPGGGGDNPNPGGGGDNPNPGGGGNPGTDGGVSTGNTQVTVVSETASPQAGKDSADNTVPAQSQNSGGQENAAGGHAISATGQTAGGKGMASGGKEPKTGDTSYLEVYATLAMIAGLTWLLLCFMDEARGMSEREKEVFVAAFIRWGKKGGAFRKCCAMAAIFCLLAYYHTIGKRVGRNALPENYLGQAS